MSLASIVGPPPTLGASPDTLDVSRLWSPAFPDAAMVADAAGLLHPLGPWDGSEGPRYRISVGPGVVSVRSTDLARAERTRNRAADPRDRVVHWDLGPVCPGACVHDSCDWIRLGLSRAARVDDDESSRRGVVSSWSRRSRSRMTQRLSELDYAPLYAEGGIPAMVTPTYPGDWRAVVPTPVVFKSHLMKLRKRFERAWDRPMVAVWKMEFQGRGAPHVHIHMTPPTGRTKDGQTFRDWFAHTWVEIVDAESCGRPLEHALTDCCERHSHLAVHLGPKVIDYGEGMRSADPRRLAVYFAKHGAYAAKEYQNHAPAEWLHDESCPDHGTRWRVLGVCDGCRSVGRFWGYWHLAKATVDTEVTPAEAQAAIRTLRRYARANHGRVVESQGINGHTVRTWQPSTVERAYVGTRLDRATGEITQVRGTMRVRFRVRRLTQRGGFLVVNSGPRVVSQLSAYLDQVAGRDVRSIYGHEIGAARNKERTPTLTAKGRGLLVRARYLAAEPLPCGLLADTEGRADISPRDPLGAGLGDGGSQIGLDLFPAHA